MKMIIDIDEQHFEILQRAVRNGMGDNSQKIIANGIPLDKHDEEVIKETVASIWGKPPYTELLDKIRAEIVEVQKEYQEYGWAYDDVLEIIDKYMGVSE